MGHLQNYSILDTYLMDCHVLYCNTESIYFISTGEHNPAIWEDITENKTLQFVNDCVSFTTTVSARFVH